eukprot:scaffold49143_cov40-Phaeocystis_antarctica.AAC.3
MRLNSSKQPHAPVCARPEKMLAHTLDVIWSEQFCTSTHTARPRLVRVRVRVRARVRARVRFTVRARARARVRPLTPGLWSSRSCPCPRGRRARRRG